MQLYIRLVFTIALIFQAPMAFAIGRIQGADVKNQADIQSTNGTATGNLTLSSACVSSLSFSVGTYAKLIVGAYIYDSTNPTYISSGTTILGLPGSCSAGQVQMSSNATHAATGDTLTFGGSISQFIHDNQLYVGANGVNDTLYNAITNGNIGGSGGGATGIELLPNPGFESGGATTNWSSTGGTVATVSSGINLLYGKKSASWQATASGQIFESAVLPIQGLVGGNCSASIYYTYAGSAGDYTLSVTDGTSTLSSVALPVNSVASVPQSISFPCGASTSSTLQWQLKSTVASPSIIYFDNAHLGSLSLLYVNQPLPVGTIFPFGSTTCPTGALSADGSAISRTQYSTLFAVMGTTYGVGDGSTTFNLPNGKGVFLRGDGTQTIGGIATPTIVAGTTQGDQMQGHHHVFQGGNTINSGGSIPYIFAPFSNTSPVTDADAGYSNSLNNAVANPVTDGTNGTPRTGTETRPANIGVHYCVQDQIQQIAYSPASGGLSAGDIVETGAQSCPVGTLVMDGTSYPTATYPDLFAAIGYTYGGSGANFNVPNGQGVFLRGAGSQIISSISYTGTQGTTQGDQMQGHTHAESMNNGAGGAVTSITQTGSLAGVATYANIPTGVPVTDGTNGTPRTGTETRPANITVKRCIRTVAASAAPILVGGTYQIHRVQLSSGASWTVPAGTTLATVYKVTCVGGGGGGGGGADSGAAGGGGGGWGIALVSGLVSGNAVSTSFGSGGSAVGLSSNSSGGSGGSTSFGSYCTGAAGGGGAGGSSSATPGGAGGCYSVATSGGCGNDGTTGSSVGSYGGVGGNGGGSLFGGGGSGGNANVSAPSAGRACGAGGGGNGYTASSGSGLGAAGCIVIEWNQ
jgi:microcystin-dependent protein